MAVAPGCCRIEARRPLPFLPLRMLPLAADGAGGLRGLPMAFGCGVGWVGWGGWGWVGGADGLRLPLTSDFERWPIQRHVPSSLCALL